MAIKRPVGSAQCSRRFIVWGRKARGSNPAGKNDCQSSAANHVSGQDRCSSTGSGGVVVAVAGGLLPRVASTTAQRILTYYGRTDRVARAQATPCKRAE